MPLFGIAARNDSDVVSSAFVSRCPARATAIRAALEAAQGVLDRSGVSPRAAFKAYQAFAAGEGGPDSLALAFARAEAEAMDTLAAYGYVRYGSVSLAAL